MRITKILENEINRANAALLKQVQYIFDTRINEIEIFAIQMAMNPRINNIIHINDPDNPLQKIYYHNVMQDLRAYKSQNLFISNFYIYMKNSDMVLTPNNQMDKQSFFVDFHQSDRLKFDEWKKMLEQPHAKRYMTLYTRESDGSLIKNICLLQSLPPDSPKNPSATLVILIDELKLKKSLQNIEWVKQGNILVMDKDDQIIVSNREDNFRASVQYKQLNQKSDLFYDVIDKKKHAVSYISSEVTDWKYICIIPFHVFWEKAVYVKQLLIGAIILCFVLGGIAVRFLIKNNYNPIKQIIHDISVKTGIYDKSQYGEYEFIYNRFNSIFNEREKLNEVIEDQVSALKPNFFMKLLKGNIDEDILLKEKLLQYNIHLLSNKFAVVLFYIEDFSLLFPDNKSYYGKKPLNIVKFMVENVVNELFENKHQAFFTEIDGITACIINFTDMDQEECEKDLKDKIVVVQKFFEDNFKVYFSAAISNLHEGLGGISGAYYEALDALEYRMILGDRQIIQYSLLPQKSETNYSYSLDVEQKLINSIKTGNEKIAKEVIQEILDKSFAKENMTVQMVKCLMYDIASTMFKMFDYIREPLALEKLQPVRRILVCHTIMDLKRELVDIVEQICRYVKEQEESFQLSDKVIAFINKNYRDMNINVNSIGSEFDMTPYYLSKLFKQQTGLALPDYINKVRVEKSKHLLQQTDKSINEISNAVGYINSNAFIRIFKKVEGMTPGQYKESTDN